MSVTVLSSDVVNNLGGNSVTAGSGLGGVALGNLLVAHFIFNDTSGTVSPPAGWTFVNQEARGGAVGATSSLYYKVALAGDVSSPSYTFSVTGGASTKARLCLIKIQAGRVSSPVTTDGHNQSASSPIVASTVTPTIANSLLVFFVTTNDAGGISNYQIPTSNPVWTEQYDSSCSGAFKSSMAYASRPETTATGTPSADTTSGGDGLGQIIVVAGAWASSQTETESVIDSIKKAWARTFSETEHVVDSVDDSVSMVWHNTTKNATPSWLNTNK